MNEGNAGEASAHYNGIIIRVYVLVHGATPVSWLFVSPPEGFSPSCRAFVKLDFTLHVISRLYLLVFSKFQGGRAYSQAFAALLKKFNLNRGVSWIAIKNRSSA